MVTKNFFSRGFKKTFLIKKKMITFDYWVSEKWPWRVYDNNYGEFWGINRIYKKKIHIFSTFMNE